ncbi:MAG: RNA methyltransferase [Alistipes sp.]
MTKSDIQLVRSLTDKRSRTATGLFVAEGEKLIGELRDSQLHVARIFALQGVFYGPEVEVVSPKDMERLSQLKTPSSALALIELPSYELQPQHLKHSLVLALDNIQNPGNMGTIIRLADWFGITDVVCSRATADCFNPKVVQATMGAIVRVRVHYTDLEPCLAECAEQGIPIYGTFLEGENIFNAPLSQAGIIVMGNEGQGVSHGVERLITRKLFIPPYPADRQGSESLNVAMATGIICAQFRSR